MPGGQMSVRDMLADLKAEAGHSLNLAHGVNARETMIYLLKRTQRELYLSNDWPFLLADTALSVVEGDSLYNYPTDTPFEQVNHVWCGVGSEWTRLDYGISPWHRSQYPATTRSWPILRWQHHARNGQMEVWPTPNQDGKLVLQGQLALEPMVNDGDMSTLDGTLIVLFAAASVLARQKAEDASIVLQKAQNYLRHLLMNQSADKQDAFIIGGANPNGGLGPGGKRKRPGLDYIPMS